LPLIQDYLPTQELGNLCSFDLSGRTGYETRCTNSSYTLTIDNGHSAIDRSEIRIRRHKMQLGRPVTKNISSASLSVRLIICGNGKHRNRQILKNAIFLILLCAFPARSQDLMSKPMWANDIVVSVPGVLCVPEQSFLACFSTDVSGCTQTMEKVATGCLESLGADIPDMLNPAEQIEWGTATQRKCLTSASLAIPGLSLLPGFSPQN